MASSNTKKIILAKPADWDPWISFVRNRAKASRIWDLVDPNLPERPEQLQRPTKPVFVRPLAGGLIDASVLELYKIDMSEYKSDLAEYEQQEKAFGDLIIFIQETIAAHNVIFIQKEDSHPWSILRALKNRLAPSDTARSLAIEQKYHKLCKGPGTQDPEAWIDQWITNYTEAKEVGIGEVAGTRPIRDFLMAIRGREPTYADAHLVFLDAKKPDDLYGLIENFRQHIRLQNLQNPKGGEHTAFATKSGGASFRGQSQSSQSSLQPSKACICGEMHWLSDCYILVPEKQPSGWKPNPNKQKKVDEALKDDRTKTWVEKVLHKSKHGRYQAGNQDSSSGPSTPKPSSTEANSAVYTGETGAFTCAFSATTGSLKGSWILDNGSNSHMCNSTMLSRFTKTRDAGPLDTLTTGTQTIPIKCFGTIQITMKAPTTTGYATMTLLNVAFVSNFMTNLVSQSILAAKGVYFDGWKNRLHRDGSTIGFVEPLNGHYIMEKNLETLMEPYTSTTNPGTAAFLSESQKSSFAASSTGRIPPTPPITPKITTSAFAKLAKSRPPPIPWHSKPKTYDKSAYMTMEDLFRKFAPNKTHLPQSTPHRTYLLHQHTKLNSQSLKSLHSPVIPHSKSAATYHTDTISASDRCANSQARKGGSFAILARAKWKSPLETLWKGLERGSRLATMTSAKADKLTDGNNYEDPD